MVFSSAILLFEEVEYVLRNDFVLRLVPADFEVFFPVLGPWPSVVIDEAWIRARRLHGFSVDIPDVAQAFNVGVPAVRIVEAGRPVELHREMQRLDEGLRIVEHRL